MPIDCLQTAINYLSLDADLNTLTAGRLASKHKFGIATGGWPTPSKALTLAYDPGATPDIDAGTERARLRARCWGESPEEAGKVYNLLMDICQDFTVRKEVQTSGGRALLYQLYPASGPRSDRDPDVSVDFVEVFLQTAVHRDPI